MSGSCEKVRSHLDSYLSNEVPVETSHAVREHLEWCQACSSELEIRTRLRSRLRAAAQAQEVPAFLQAKVLRKIRENEPAQESRRNWSAWMLAAAAMALLAVGGWVTLRLRHASPELPTRAEQDAYIGRISSRLAQILRVGLGDHVHCSVFRKYPKNPPSAEEMSRLMGPEYSALTPLVKQRVPQEYRVILAHKCGYLGRQFVHLTLRQDSSLVSLVVTAKKPGESFDTLQPARTASGLAIYQAGVALYEVAGFESRDHLAFVVSDLGGSNNLQLAASLAPGVKEFLGRLEL